MEEERGVCVPLVEALPDSSSGAARTPFPAPPLRAARQRPRVERSGDAAPLEVISRQHSRQAHHRWLGSAHQWTGLGLLFPRWERRPLWVPPAPLGSWRVSGEAEDPRAVSGCSAPLAESLNPGGGSGLLAVVPGRPEPDFRHSAPGHPLTWARSLALCPPQSPHM